MKMYYFPRMQLDEEAVPFSPHIRTADQIASDKANHVLEQQDRMAAFLKKNTRPKPIDRFEVNAVHEIVGIVSGPVRLQAIPGTSQKEKRCTIQGPDGIFPCVIPGEVDAFLHEGDRVSAFAQKEANGHWRWLPYGDPDLPPFPPPRVVVDELDREELLRFFHTRGKLSQREAQMFYDMQTRNPDDVSGVITSLHREAARFQRAVASEHADGLKALTQKYPLIESKRVTELFRTWYCDITLRRFYVLGITRKVLRACTKYDSDLEHVYSILTTNPYKMLQLPLERADWILTVLRVPIDPLHRRVGEIARELARVMEERGHSCLTANQAYALFGEEFFNVARLLPEYKIAYDTDRKALYTEYSLRCENEVAKYVTTRLAAPSPLGIAPDDIASVAEQAHLDPSQVEALEGVCANAVSIITGRPGTGKTTLLMSFVTLLESAHIPYILCAFTGKAVSRIRQAVRRAAYTIHSTIMRGAEGVETVRSRGTDRTVGAFVYDPRNEMKSVVKETRVQRDMVLIVDEVSMLPTYLFEQVARTLGQRVRHVTLCGDVEQLPPIEWGSFMRELIRSECVPVFRLTTMHRVSGAEGRDALIRTVDALNSGEPGFKFIPSPTFHVLHGGIEAVGDVLDGLMDEGVDIADVACITPYVANIDALNTAVRCRWFPDTLEDGDDAPVWYVGARVMQTENNPKTGLMNGMEGLIVDVNEVDEELTVEFEMFLNEPDAARRDDGRLFKCFTYRIGTHPNKVEPDGVTLEWAKGKSIEEQTKEKKQRDEQDAAPDLYTSELAISFGATIHKQQGSEYPIIVFYCPASAANGHFLTRELVNVAITRAKKRVFVVGDIQAIEAAVARPVPRRQAFLAERLIEMRGAK